MEQNKRIAPQQRDEPFTDESMKLPIGETCGNCYAFAHCEVFYQHIAIDEVCDFAPSRFHKKRVEGTLEAAAGEKPFHD